MPPTSRILLADADAFFVAVARLCDPEGAGRQKYLVVGGSAAGRGVVTSASYETRAYGVRSGMPTAQALRLCPQAITVGVPRRACAEKSREIRSVLERFTPSVQAASIDEFYLDLTGTERLYSDEPLAETAARIRETVIRETGLTVSIGCGTSKLIAKLAAKRAKPHRNNPRGVHAVPAGEEQAFLATLDLADIPGIGPRLQEQLANRGLKRVQDALNVDTALLESWFGTRTGTWLYKRMRGLDEGTVTPHVRAKSLSHEETFAVDLHRDEDLDRELLRLATRVAADMRARDMRARTMTVKIRDYDFQTRQASQTLAESVSSDRPIYTTARELLARLRRARRAPARLLGVAASNFVDDDDLSMQVELFQQPSQSALETERDRDLDRALDAITARFGRSRIVRAKEVSE